MLQRRSEYFAMVECQGWRAKRRVPLGLGGVIAGPDSAVVAKNSSEGNAHRMAPGIAAWITECRDLFQTNALDASFLFELTQSGMFERLVLVNESARQRPFPFKGTMRPPD